jgi:hypothetical protein
VVYGRCGYRQALPGDDAVGSQGESLNLRDDEQVLVKFSYRFEK